MITHWHDKVSRRFSVCIQGKISLSVAQQGKDNVQHYADEHHSAAVLPLEGRRAPYASASCHTDVAAAGATRGPIQTSSMADASLRIRSSSTQRERIFWATVASSIAALDASCLADTGSLQFPSYLTITNLADCTSSSMAAMSTAVNPAIHSRACSCNRLTMNSQSCPT